MAELRWHPEAVADLEAACAYVARDSPAAARALARRMLVAVERLAEFPHSGRAVPEAGDDAIREVLVSPYRVIYRILGVDVQIVMVHHSAQALRQIREADVP